MKKILLFRAGCCILICSLLYACNSTGNEAALREEIAGLKEKIKLLEAPDAPAAAGETVHTVMFSLKHPLDAPETTKFLQDGQQILSAIPAVENFQVLTQVSPKNEFKFLFSMKFANQEAYRAYNNHPEHVKFVKERWDVEVADFLEADFVELPE